MTTTTVTTNALPQTSVAANSQTASRSARTFLALFLTTVLAGIVAMAAIAVYVNPWGNYGPKGYFHLYNARLAKAQHLATLDPAQRPQVLILGSSNVMRFRPQTVERLLGKTAFNFGVFWGRADDLLCITRFVVDDLHHKPELLIVGMDTWTLEPAVGGHPVYPGVRRRLLNAPQLVRHHPDVTRAGRTWSAFIDIFSEQQLRAALRNVRRPSAARRSQKSLDVSSMFNIDGTRVSYGDVYGGRGNQNIFDQVETGEYPITDYLHKAAAGNNLIHLPKYLFDEFAPRRVDYLEQMVALCEQHGIQVVFVLNPVHPVFSEVLATSSQHERNTRRLHSLLNTLGEKYAVIQGVVDASRIEHFGGDASGFYDEIHAATANCDRILELVAKQVQSH